MAYIGSAVTKESDIKRITFATSTTGSGPFALGWAPDSEASLRVTINGVVQHDPDISVSGSNLTISETLVSGDELEVVGIVSVGSAMVPQDGSVTTAKLADDSVTAAKVTLPLGIKIITGITTAYEITAADMADTTHLVVFFAAGGSAYDIKCPTAANMSGKMITIVNDAGGTASGGATLKHNAGGTISGVANIINVPGYVTVVSNGTNVFKCTDTAGGGSVL